MRIIDSISYSHAQQYNNDATEEPGTLKHSKNTQQVKEISPKDDENFRPLPVSKTKEYKTAFNTAYAAKSEKSIKAIIDEEKKVFNASRIRIRLLDDIYVGGELTPKGTYIYAMITGFQTQRINLTVTSIMKDETPLPVKLDLFDQDGYLGLYVPGSNFREFTKEIGTRVRAECQLYNSPRVWMLRQT